MKSKKSDIFGGLVLVIGVPLFLIFDFFKDSNVVKKIGDMCMFAFAICLDSIPIIMFIIIVSAFVVGGILVLFDEAKIKIRKLLYKCGFKINPDIEWTLVKSTCIKLLSNIDDYDFLPFVNIEIEKIKSQNNCIVFEAKHSLIVAKIICTIAVSSFQREGIYKNANLLPLYDIEKLSNAAVESLHEARKKKALTTKQFNSYIVMIREDVVNPFSQENKI